MGRLLPENYYGCERKSEVEVDSCNHFLKLFKSCQRLFQSSNTCYESGYSRASGYGSKLHFNIEAGNRRFRREIRCFTLAEQSQRPTAKSFRQHWSNLWNPRVGNLSELAKLQVGSTEGCWSLLTLYRQQSIWYLHHLWVEQEESLRAVHWKCLLLQANANGSTGHQQLPVRACAASSAISNAAGENRTGSCAGSG